MTLLLALGLGVLIGWVLSRGPRKPSAPAAAEASARPVLPGLGRLQLLAWLEGAPQGWLVLDGDQRIQAINPRAERLLQLPADRLVRGQPLRAVIQQAELEEAILSAAAAGGPSVWSGGKATSRSKGCCWRGRGLGGALDQQQALAGIPARSAESLGE